MLLKSLELHGFKTFPDKTVLNFEDGITAVVGPNGSGKSNISDAMRWVLGEQSTRALRCSRMEDIIFSGTPQRKAQGYAEVTLTVDNADRGLNFDGDTVAITRRFYRSGESEYQINRTTVRLKDIHELFMDTGLGRDGYSMIGQGRIDAIVSARSEDRREIFEEAAGISRFRYRKEEAERRLARAEENLVRLRDILSELESRVEPLREQAEKAEKFIALDAEKKELEIGLWLETLNRSGKTVREAEERIGAAESSYREAEKALEDLAKEIEQNYNETNDCTARMEQVRNEAAETDEVATRRDGEISVAENDLAHFLQTVERLEGEIAESSRSVEELRQEAAEKEKAAAGKDGEIARNNADLIAYTAELEAVRQSADGASERINAVAAELAKVSDALAQVRVRYAEAEASVQEILHRSASVDGAIAESEARRAALEAESRELSEMIRETEDKIAAGENTARGYEMRLESRRGRVEKAKSEAEKLRLDAAEQERRAKLLEDLERNLEGFTQSVKTVMREKNRGTLSGVHGPVTQLIRVQREYAVALETALGAAMQNVVVDDENAAKNAIRLLKQRDAGRATFLPLTTVRGSVVDVREVRNAPGFVGVASELCTVDPKYNGIRDSLLGRTVVAETLDNAAQIARRMQFRTRVVSLDGQVVNAGGSFTGGSAARNSGLLSRAGEIERIRALANELKKKAAEANERLKAAAADEAKTAAELEAARSALQALREDRVRFLAEQTQAVKALENEKRGLAGLLEEKENAAGRVEAQKEAAKKAAEEAEKLEEEARAVREKMGRAEENRKEQLCRADEMSLHLQELRLAGLTLQKDRDTLLQSIEALTARQEDRESRTRALSEQAAETKRGIEQKKEQIAALQAETRTLREQAAQKRERIAQISERRGELERRAVELRQKERDCGTEREKTGLELARLRERLDNLTKEYDAIIAKLWDEYELTRREAEEIGKPVENVQAAQRRLTELKNRIRSLGAVNVAAIVEYKEVLERYTFMRDQIRDVETSRTELMTLIGDLTRQMTERFSERFSEINERFGRIFRDLSVSINRSVC